MSKSNNRPDGTSVSPKASKAVVVRQCLAADVSKDDLKVCFKEMDGAQDSRIRGQTTFKNSPAGWANVKKYAEKYRKPEVPFLVVMEATGVYHEELAYFLREQGIPCSVVLPNKSKNYAKSLNVKTKNDKVDAQVLAQMGLDQKLALWQGLNPVMRKIKRLLREKDALQKYHLMLGNQSHARAHSHKPEALSQKRTATHQKLIEKQIREIEKQVLETLGTDAELKAKVDKVCTIKGVGVHTALSVIAEANGFELIANKAQLVSYAGYDVIENTSGTSVRGNTRISKKGNSHIRKALYFPALTAAQHDPKMKSLYQRITARNPKVKMIGLVAVQRKILVLIYTLFKNNTAFDPKYEQQQLELKTQKNRQTLLESLPTLHGQK